MGKDYDTEEFELVDVPGRTSKKALLEDPDRTYFPKRFSEVNIDKGLPMSWIVRDYEVKSGSPTGTPGEPLEAQLVRCVAKLNISMNNDLDSEINIKAVNFGTFFGDRLYLFGEQSLDVPGSTAYEAKSYPYETEADYIKIPANGEKMLYATSTFLRLAAGNDGLALYHRVRHAGERDLSPKGFHRRGCTEIHRP